MAQIKTLIEFTDYFRDKKICREFLEEHRWHGTPICPHCHEQSNGHYKLKVKGEFNGLYKCRACRKTFTVTVGTIFEGSHVALRKWFIAIYLHLTDKKGINSILLAKHIGVTQPTAWFMLSRIAHNLDNREETFNNPFDGVVQMDETYVGGKNKGRFKNNRGRSTKQKTPVAGVLTKDRVCTMVVPNTRAVTLKPIVYRVVKSGATLVTDDWLAYRGLSREYDHKVVEHSKHKYAVDGFHTNGIEGFWSQLKRGINGTHHRVSRQHLQSYCNAYAYRYNTRMLSDMQRFTNFISAKHTRLRYAELMQIADLYRHLW